MPAVDHPLGVAASLPGQVAALRKIVKDLSVNKTYSPASLAIGAGGLTVLGTTTLTGGVTGPVASTDALSGTSLTVTGAVAGAAITGTSLAVGAGAISGATVTTTGAATIGAGVSIGASATLTGDVFIPNRTPVISGYAAAWINSDGRIGISASSERYKQDITPREYALEQIDAIEVVSYRLIAAVEQYGDFALTDSGVIAEQLVEVGLPEFVVFNPDGTAETVMYDRLTVVAIAGVQQLAAQVRALTTRLDKAGL